MFTIYLKEIKTFFSALQGYIITGLFLLTTALFLWVIPGSWNIPESGYATLNGLFELAPWLFLFFIPAITMRMFAEEYRSGTIELIITRPVKTSGIIGGKYLAGLTLLLITLLPTLIWVITVSAIALPKGNIDGGAISGSYIALFLLGSTYVSIGVLGSSLTDNQVVAFLITLALSFLTYSGFSLLGSAPGINAVTGYMEQLGIESHYLSMSRGVIDSRDVFYFISANLFFLFAANISLKRRT
ncbi:gliding motility-associated ABC transporter permease subunit GldF [Saccharicrinis sp. FJH54]|uniref:gliding motility-associated ABC transporter permease subunit GldF n=1 Tax=Saccharicrinis sp. FJH54 TaxID=3344665 RepID=UPI0035D46E31